MISDELLVSVVIPAYNTEKYIGRMLNCAISQTYKKIEIIVINDGSTDNTLEVLRSYQIKDKRIRVIDIPNGGVSNARNLGINAATGNKILFWDSDDIVELDTIQKCVEFCEEKHVNSVLYGYCNRDNGVDQPCHQSILGGQVFKHKDILHKVMPCFIGHSFSDVNAWILGHKTIRYGKESTALWHIMCDLDIIKSNKLLFDTNLSLGEDTTFINTYFLYEESIGYLDECFYHLEQRPDGANLSSVTNATKRILDKQKLVFTRLKIDQLAIEKYEFNTHCYWEGTLAFSVLEMALRMSHNYHSSDNDNKARYLDFVNIDTVKESIKNFRPSFGIKAIPFLLLKFIGPRKVYNLCRLIPDKYIRVIV